MLILSDQSNQNNFAGELKSFEKCTEKFEKQLFLINLGLLFSAIEKVINIFKSRLFLIQNLDNIPTREPTPEAAAEPEVAKEPATDLEVATNAKTKRKISSLKLRENFLNGNSTEEKNINE